MKKSSYWDGRISMFVAFYFIASTCNMAIKNIFPIPVSLWGVLSALWGMGILFFMLRGIKEVIKRNGRLLFQSYAIFVVLFAISILMASLRGEPYNAILRDCAFVTLAWWIPLGVFSCSVKDKRILYYTLYKYSFLISFVLLLYFYLGKVVVINDKENDYSMTFGLALIFPILLHINELFIKKRLWLIVLVVIEILTVLIFANRTVLLSILFFLLYKWTVGNHSTTKRFVILLAGIGLVFLYSFYFDSLLTSSVSFLDSHNMQSRTLSMMASNDIYSDSGRGEIWSVCYRMIMERPFLGWGIGGEFYTIAEYFGSPNSVTGAFSTHNGLLQALVNFGIIGGVFVIIIYVIPLFLIGKIKDKYLYDLVLMSGAIGFIPCLVSASGLFTKPELALYIYLFYYGTMHSQPFGKYNNNFSH